MIFRRTLTLSLFNLCLSQALGNIIILANEWRKKRNLNTDKTIKKAKHRNMKNSLEFVTNLIFVVHAICGFQVVIDINNGVFDVATVSFLVISCAGSLLYACFMSWILSFKLKVMNFKYGMHLFGIFVFFQIICKLASFIIVFYILFSNWGASDLLAGFLTPIGTAGSYLNLTGNFLYRFHCYYNCIICSFYV